MKIIDIYFSSWIKNNEIISIRFYNENHNFIKIINLDYYSLKTNLYLYKKLIKKFLKENGFKKLIYNRWYKFGIKHNFIYDLLIKKWN